MSVAPDPPSPPNLKLPLWNTISLSYLSYFRHFVDILRISWLWLAAAAILTFMVTWQQWSRIRTVIADAERGVPSAKPDETFLFGKYLLLMFACTSIAVAWHRLLVLGERPGLSGSNLATKYLWRYFGVGAAICLIVLLPLAIIIAPQVYFLFPLFALKASGGLPPPDFIMFMLVFLVLCVLSIAVALRLSLLLPARAAGNEGLTFKQTWQRTRGNTWRILWGLAACTVPSLIVGQIAFFFAIQIAKPNVGQFAQFTGDVFVFRKIILSTGFIIFYLIISPIGVGFLSHAYRHFLAASRDPVLRSS